MEHEKCKVCGKKNKTTKTQMWHLIRYYGLSGFLCRVCFKKVAHRDGNPNHPIAYLNILNKLKNSNLQDSAYSTGKGSLQAAPDVLAALRKAVVVLAGACMHCPEIEPHEAY